MAFLVCYKKKAVETDWKDKAIYLDQEFYELLFYRLAQKDSILKKISRLGYDTELEVENSQLMGFKVELLELDCESKHSQIEEFIAVVDRCIASNDGLAVTGDMAYVLT